MLGTEFYEREHSKPLFKKYNFLTVHNLYKYHCLLEMFKIVKLRKPMPVYELLGGGQPHFTSFGQPKKAKLG